MTRHNELVRGETCDGEVRILTSIFEMDMWFNVWKCEKCGKMYAVNEVGKYEIRRERDGWWMVAVEEEGARGGGGG